jgi:hypothetical protein
MNIFEKATKKRLRFDCGRGTLSVEDLWNLSLEELDQIYRDLSAEKRDTSSEGLLVTLGVNKELLLRLDIVKHIFEERQKSAEIQKRRLATRARNQRILELIEKKNDESLESQSVEELQALLAESSAEAEDDD